MSAIVVVSIEGVLCPLGEALPNAQPVLAGIQLVNLLSEGWPLGFISEAPVETTKAWLREVHAPTACWVATAPRDSRAAVILRLLAERRDRAQYFFAGEALGFEELAFRGVSNVMLAHSSSFALGDWKQESSWDGNEPEEEEEDDAQDPLQRS